MSDHVVAFLVNVRVVSITAYPDGSTRVLLTCLNNGFIQTVHIMLVIIGRPVHVSNYGGIFTTDYFGSDVFSFSVNGQLMTVWVIAHSQRDTTISVTSILPVQIISWWEYFTVAHGWFQPRFTSKYYIWLICKFLSFWVDALKVYFQGAEGVDLGLLTSRLLGWWRLCQRGSGGTGGTMAGATGIGEGIRRFTTQVKGVKKTRWDVGKTTLITLPG